MTRAGKRRPDWELVPAELTEPVDGWPVGTLGTVVDAFLDEAIFEITGEGGSTLALLTVPYQLLTPVGSVIEGPVTAADVYLGR